MNRAMLDAGWVQTVVAWLRVVPYRWAAEEVVPASTMVHQVHQEAFVPLAIWVHRWQKVASVLQVPCQAPVQGLVPFQVERALDQIQDYCHLGQASDQELDSDRLVGTASVLWILQVLACRPASEVACADLASTAVDPCSSVHWVHWVRILPDRSGQGQTLDSCQVRASRCQATSCQDAAWADKVHRVHLDRCLARIARVKAIVAKRRSRYQLAKHQDQASRAQPPWGRMRPS